jgi:hypothetical protein
MAHDIDTARALHLARTSEGVTHCIAHLRDFSMTILFNEKSESVGSLYWASHSIGSLYWARHSIVVRSLAFVVLTNIEPSVRPATLTAELFAPVFFKEVSSFPAPTKIVFLTTETFI